MTYKKTCQSCGFVVVSTTAEEATKAMDDHVTHTKCKAEAVSAPGSDRPS